MDGPAELMSRRDEGWSLGSGGDRRRGTRRAGRRGRHRACRCGGGRCELARRRLGRASTHRAGTLAASTPDARFPARVQPHAPSTRRRCVVRDPVAARSHARSLIQGAGRDQLAIVKTDLYIPQDLLRRRAAQLLETGTLRHHLARPDDDRRPRPLVADVLVHVVGRVGISGRVRRAHLRLPLGSHLRGGREGVANMIAGACRGRGRPLRQDAPATRSARRSPMTGPRPAIPEKHTDHDLTSCASTTYRTPSDPKPLANFVNWSGHPEMLSGNDLISADYVGPFQRMLDRETHAVTIFSQGAVGRPSPSARVPLDSRAARVQPPRLRPGRVRGASARRQGDGHGDASRAATREQADRYMPF